MNPIVKNIAVLISILTLVLYGCAEQGEQDATELPISETYFIFDTVVSVRVYDNSVTKQHFSEVENILHAIDAKMNRLKAGSELERVNRSAGVKSEVVSADTMHVVKAALDFAMRSGGKFEPTIGPLVDLWGIGQEGVQVPKQADIDQMLPLIDYKQVIVDEEASTIYLEQAGMSLDLGAIAKGYAADQIAAYLKEEQLQGAIIDLGGNIFAMGSKPSGDHWVIGIQDPDEQRGDYVGLLSIGEKTVVTSGIYERYFVEDGQHYHHIFDSSSGYPVENNLLSVTIITDSSLAADALSTTVFALGMEDGMAFVEQEEGTEAIFITKDKHIYVTSGLGEEFTMTNSRYELRQ